MGSQPLVVIVGGGPAGLIAAEVLSERGHRVVVFERMPSLGRKLLMAGRGGLNLTHSEPWEAFVSRYGPLAPQLAEALKAFPPERLVAWAEGLGEPTFVGSSGRIFPRRMKASPLLRAWLRRLDARGVAVRLRHRWDGWSGDGALAFIDASGQRVEVHAEATLLAVGGASWPRLGSDGAWVKTLEQGNVPVAPLSPSNAGALVSWSDVFTARWNGTPLKRIAATCEGRTQRGEAMITRTGLEGGAIYALSPLVRNACLAGGFAEVVLDLKPDDSLEALARKLATPRGKQSTSNFLRKAAGLSPVATNLLREVRGGPLPAPAQELAALIKRVPIKVRGLAGLERAISTAGGVPFDSIDPHFMLKALPGVFVAGEMLDWDAPTGGYLLQATFATGVAAAHGLARWLAPREHSAARAR